MKDFPEHQKIIAKVKSEISHSRNTGSGHVVFLMISGSHMYGFNSPNSDIDYRGAYVGETNHLLGLKPPADVYRRDDGVVDVELFELRKFVQMALNMNCNVIEHLFANETMIYETSWLIDMQKMFRNMFCKKGLFDSYKGMASQNYKKFINREGLDSDKVSKPGTKPTIKKYLYVLRGLMAGSYALEFYDIQPNILYLNEYTTKSDLVEKLVMDKREGTEKMEANYNPLTIRKLDKLIKEQYTRLLKIYEDCELPDIQPEENIQEVDKWLKKVRRQMLQV